MFKALFVAILLATLLVNLLFLFATRDRPADLDGAVAGAGAGAAGGGGAGSTGSGFSSPLSWPVEGSRQTRRLFLRSNYLEDQATPTSLAAVEPNLEQKKESKRDEHVDANSDQDGHSSGSDREDGNIDIDHSNSVPKTTEEDEEEEHEEALKDENRKSSDKNATHHHMGRPSDTNRRRSSWRRRKLVFSPNHSSNVISGSTGSEQTTSSKDNNNNNPPREEQESHRSSEPAGGNQLARPLATSHLDIRVKSSRKHVLVSVDGSIIYESGSAALEMSEGGTPEARGNNGRSGYYASSSNEDQAGRGIHVLVLSQFDGRIMSRRIFDTYATGQDDELVVHLSMVREGRLLILAVQDEASFGMGFNSAARKLLSRLGSRHISRLSWRDMWAFVGRKSVRNETDTPLGGRSIAGKADCAETLAKSARLADWAPPVILETRVQLERPPGEGERDRDRCSAWQLGGPEELERRAKFCDQVEGYGRVCDCQHPAQIGGFTNHNEQLDNWQLDLVPILVMASNRPYYLYRMLGTLLEARGLRPEQVLVSIDGFYDEPKQVADLFHLRSVQMRPRGRRAGRISHHYLTSLTEAFSSEQPNSCEPPEFAVIFEEDLDVAEDTLLYFNQTLPLLRSDPSLYCVSAWNDQGYLHTAQDPDLVYRIETMPGLGWMLSRRLFETELKPRWPPAEQPHDWDMWIRTSGVRRGRECLIPDVSRTYHFGSAGTNINAHFQRQYFAKHAFRSPQGVEVNSHFWPLEQLSPSSKYEQLVERMLERANPFRPQIHETGESSRDSSSVTQQVCSLAGSAPSNQMTPRNLKNNNSTVQEATVIYIQMIEPNDYANWLRLARCWRIWDLDARGQHKSMWRLFLGGRGVMVVGVPASPYSRFKPADLEPIRLVG